jgi:branched-chain amino acid transport system permease protein
LVPFMNGSKKLSVKRKLALSIIGLFLLVTPLIVNAPYYLHLLILTGILSIVAMGVVIQLKAGLLSMGSAVYWGIGAYASALFSLKLGFSFWLCLPLAGIVAAAIALGIGIAIVRAGSVGFLMLTIVINGTFVELLGRTSLFGGWDGFTGITRPSVHIPYYGLTEIVTKSAWYCLLVFLFLLVILGLYALYSSRIGTGFKVVGLSAKLAASMGINVFGYKLAAYVIAGFVAGLSGSFFAHYQGYLVPRTFDIWPSVLLLMYPIVGGTDYVILGPIAGTSLLVIAPEVLRVTQLFEPIFFGLILIATVIFLHGGLLSLPKRISSLSMIAKGHRTLT